MSAQFNNNADAAEFNADKGQINEFGQSGQWHDASELSRKDAVPSAGIEAAPNSVIIAEKALGAEFQEKKQEASEFLADKKEEAKEALQDGAAKAEGLTARAYEKAGEIYEKVIEKVAPMADFAAAAYDRAASTAAAAGSTLTYAKDAIVENAHALADKVVEIKDNFAGRTAEVKDAAAEKATDAKETAKDWIAEKTGETAEGSQAKAQLPSGPLSDISAAELLLQKAKINLTADFTKMNDASLPLKDRAAAAADAVAQKATVLFEQGVIAKSNLMEKISPAATERPAQPMSSQ